jgi:hypothetical protein
VNQAAKDELVDIVAGELEADAPDLLPPVSAVQADGRCRCSDVDDIQERDATCGQRGASGVFEKSSTDLVSSSARVDQQTGDVDGRDRRFLFVDKLHDRRGGRRIQRNVTDDPILICRDPRGERHRPTQEPGVVPVRKEDRVVVDLVHPRRDLNDVDKIAVVAGPDLHGIEVCPVRAPDRRDRASVPAYDGYRWGRGTGAARARSGHGTGPGGGKRCAAMFPPTLEQASEIWSHLG